MPKGIAYIRVSKARDNMITQNTQMSKIEQYCELHDIDLVDSYSDLDYSGRSTNRPDFQQFFNDIHNDNLNADYLLVYKLDRFARSVNDFHRYMKVLDQHDINFVSITQQFDTSTPMGRLVRNILVDFAQFESEMVGERVRDNMMENASRGVWNGGPVPLGFKINEDEEGPNLKPSNRAEDIIKFYEWYLKPNGTIRSNVHKANKLDIPSSTGGNWNPNQMGRLLKNPIYCIADEKSIKYFENQGFEVLNKEVANNKRGFIRYNRRKPKGTTTKIQDKDKWLIAVAQHEGIVPSEVFIKVQRKRSKRANKPTRAGTGESLLAWLVKCGKCNKAMTYSYSTTTLADGTKKRYNYYRCRAKQHQGPEVCEGQSVRAEKLEKIVLNKLSSICNDNNFLDGAEKKLDSKINDTIEPLKDRQEKIKDKIAKIDQEEDNLIETIKNGTSDRLLSVIEKKVDELDQKRKKLETQLENIEEQLLEQETTEYNKKFILTQLKEFDENFDSMEFEEKRNFLQTIINRIIYDEGKVKLELFLADLSHELHFSNERTRIHSSY